MKNIPSLVRPIIRTLITAASLVSLAACGGGGDTGNSANTASASGAASGTSGGQSSSATSAFVQSIFLETGGTGYVSFASSQNAAAQYTGIATEQLSLTGATSTVFNEQTSAVLGQFSTTLVRQTIVTASGDYSTLGLGNDIQIFTQGSTGFTFGLGGAAAVLQATLTPADVSGQSVASVATDASGGVAFTLAADTSAMPAGSVRYTTQLTATAPVLVVQSGTTAGTQSLAQLQQQFGGTTATLGDTTYLTGMNANAPVAAYAQLNGSIYPASFAAAGQAVPLTLLVGTSTGYNLVASNFISQELRAHAASL
jgi:hypothetical protein